MTQLTFTGGGQFRVGSAPVPVRHAGEALIAPRLVGICATDIELLDGEHPYFAHGLATYPLQPGHEWMGRIVESDDAAFPPGTRVVGDPEVRCGRADCGFCTRGHTPWCPDRTEIGCRGGRPGGAATRIVLPVSSLHVVPDGVDDASAVLSEPTLTVIGGLDRVGPLDGRSVLIIGAGTIGIIAAQVCAGRGSQPTILARSALRREAIPQFTTVPALEPEARYDVVIVAAGTPEAFMTGLGAVANGGALVLLGVPGEPVDGVDVASILHKDMSIFGVLNYSTFGPTAMQTALQLIADGVITSPSLVDEIVPLDRVGDALDRARRSDRARPKILISLPESD